VAASATVENLQTMKITYLSVFPPYRGGISQYAASLEDALKGEHEVKAINFKRQYPNFLFPGKSQFLDSADAFNYPAERCLDALNPFSYRKTARKIIEDQPDVLLVNYWMPFFAPALGSIAYLVRRKGIKIIAILHNLIPHERRIGDRLLNRFFINQVDHFVVMGSSVGDDLLGLKPDASFTLHPHPLYDHFGVAQKQEDARLKLRLPQDKKILLFFGLIRAYKGLEKLIKAFELLSNEYALLIAGESYEPFERYQKLIDQQSKSRLIFPHIRYIPDQEVPTFFSAADLCVLPYETATQSGVSSIAFHFDVPVLSTDVGSLRETIQLFKGGEVVPSTEPEELAKGIEGIFNSTTDYVEQIKIHKKMYSWQTLTSRIVELTK